jgi:hypothetical protein
MSSTTPPIGFDAEGNAIETVTTTATRIRSGGWLIGLVVVAGLAILGREIGYELQLQSYSRRRQVRDARRARRR